MKRFVMLAVTALLLGGCGLVGKGVYDTPLPGGADVGSDPVRLTAEFDNVLDLVPQSSVKVDNVAVGRVTSIELNRDGRSASVDLLVNSSTSLPAGTVARLQQTSLLGEKYVALVRPSSPQTGPALRSGDTIDLSDTSQAAEVEQVLGALSLVLNGGGIQQFQEISRELQDISDGRPEQVRQFLRETQAFVKTLDDNKSSITAAIDGLADLSANLERDKGKIATALEDLSPGLAVIADQRDQLVETLKALDRLSTVTVRTLNASQDDIVADLKALEPIIQQLARAGQDLPRSLEILLTYPFPDSVLGAIKGDYMNLFVLTNFRSLPAGCKTQGCEWKQAADPNYREPPPPPAANRSSRSAQQQALRQQQGADSSPTFLPPTSSSTPGSSSPSVAVPSSKAPSSAAPSSASPSTSSSANPRSSASSSEGGR